MIISIGKDKLIEPLRHIVGVSEKKQTMPILGNVLLRASNGKLLLVSSDLEVEIAAELDYPFDGQIETTLPARKLLDIVKSMPGDDPITINIEQTKAIIKSGKSKFTLATLPAIDFPYKKGVESNSPYSINIADLDNVIGQTSFSMAVQDARHFLNGLFLELDSDRLTVVATDGHRLAMSSCKTTNTIEAAVSCIIPRKCIIELKRILASFKDNNKNLAEVLISNTEITIKISTYTIKSKLIDGNYPDYNKVFPESLPHKLSANRDDFKQSLQRMAILSNEQFKGVKLSLMNDEIKLTTTNPSQEEGEDSLECVYSGDSFDVGFNLTYLLEVIDVVTSDDLELQLNNSDSGCLIVSSNDNTVNKYIIMPMRV
tara:strand:- start:925 stop:2040 length:1116 start_codon:yes stop_codon:yes gene_type:complete